MPPHTGNTLHGLQRALPPAACAQSSETRHNLYLHHKGACSGGNAGSSGDSHGPDQLGLTDAWVGPKVPRPCVSVWNP